MAELPAETSDCALSSKITDCLVHLGACLGRAYERKILFPPERLEDWRTLMTRADGLLASSEEREAYMKRAAASKQVVQLSSHVESLETLTELDMLAHASPEAISNILARLARIQDTIKTAAAQ